MISRRFEEITPEHISGHWRIKSSTLSPQVSSFPLADVTMHNFRVGGTYEADSISGKWHIERNEEIIPNPILFFEFPDTTYSAMITRLAYMPYSSDKRDELILYFSNGCELVLEKMREGENQ
ncbi:MAG TPA: hypothetical protein VEC36_04110 [Patescibacteria group bacterium]|nr:hypothetical protein [Patescibacteria group bacterium]